MLVAVGSVRYSPGVTTLVTALAARWPVAGAVVVEADPAGGDLGTRFGRRPGAGLSTLAAEASLGRAREISAYAQDLGLGVAAVLAPPDPEARQAVDVLALTGVSVLRAAAAGRAVVVDVGQLGPATPAWPLVRAADVVLVVTTTEPEGLDAVRVRRERLLTTVGVRPHVALVLTGSGPCTAEDFARTVRLPVAGTLPWDHRGAAVLAGRAPARWGWTRRGVPRAARVLAVALHERAGRSIAGWQVPSATPVAVFAHPQAATVPAVIRPTGNRPGGQP